ncbi:MAG: GNAT family N-acetyltransferase [Chloroflexi bacterium]|nr:GNAT family N-acetyltransferase [Chloroflexota bacterium]
MSAEPEAEDGEAAPAITSEDFEALEPEWAVLHAAMPGATPFSHPAWAKTWLRHFGAGAAPVFLSIREGEALIGVAALDPGQQVARQLGDHNVSDYTSLLAAPGKEAAVAAGVVEWLMEDLTAGLDLWGIPEDSPWRGAFADAAAGFGWSCEEALEAVAPRAELPGDFEAFVQGLGKHDRHELRRKLRHLAAAGEVAYEVVSEPAAVEARMERFLAFMRMSREDKDEFLTPAMEAFFRDLAATFSALGMLRLGTLSLDGAPVAMLLSFENETTAFLYNSGYDPAHAHLAVGLLSKARAIEAAIGKGLRVFDFLRGEEEYKRRLGGAPREIFALTLRRG